MVSRHEAIVSPIEIRIATDVATVRYVPAPPTVSLTTP